MDDVNTIQYCIPGNTEMKFGILSHERDVSLKLLAGAAKVYIGGRRVDLRLGEEFPIPIWESLSPILKSRTECEFIFRGNHYVYNASTKIGAICKNLFSISLNESSFIFVVEKDIQLQIFVSEMDLDSKVTITSIRGEPEIFGHKLLTGKKNFLPAGSSFLVNSSDNPYSVNIQGYKRRIKVSLIDWQLWECMKGFHTRIHKQRLQAQERKSIGPTIVVTGPKNAGKTSFCHFLLNKAVDEGMNPVFIDLNVHRNSNAIPGAMTFTEIQGRRLITVGFSHYFRHVLQFGYVNVDSNNIRLYSLLIQKMGELLKSNRVFNSRSYSGAVIEIDTCGNIFQDCSTIDCILKSFPADLVVFIGKAYYYDRLKEMVLKPKSEFVPSPESIEPLQNHPEEKSLDIKIRRCFYDLMNRPLGEHTFEVNFDVIKIYKIGVTPFMFSTRTAINANLNELSIIPVEWHPSIEYTVLAVIRAKKVRNCLPVTQVKYFVIFKKVDKEKKIVTVSSPSPDIVSGGLLLLSHLTITRDSVTKKPAQPGFKKIGNIKS